MQGSQDLLHLLPAHQAVSWYTSSSLGNLILIYLHHGMSVFQLDFLPAIVASLCKLLWLVALLKHDRHLVTSVIFYAAAALLIFKKHHILWHVWFGGFDLVVLLVKIATFMDSVKTYNRCLPSPPWSACVLCESPDSSTWRDIPEDSVKHDQTVLTL